MLPRLPDSAATCTIGEWQPSVTAGAYLEALRRIEQHIRRGDTYQVNFTYRQRAPFSGDSWAFFRRLEEAQRADYSAYLDMGRFCICSASPELFFSLEGGAIRCQPMKGTAARGLTLDWDRQQAEWLRRSEKNRAENVMIVDMVRNDLARIPKVRDINPGQLFEVGRYPTLWQMTSTITARTEAPLPEIFQALFPCASITGAPKPSTMDIIRRLECSPRGIYCGCLGFIAPGRRAQFNVAIRTARIDRTTREVEYGVGGGITADSLGTDEYSECRLKSGERKPSYHR